MTKGLRNGEPDARQVYADIIDLPHWQSQKRPHMGALERAAQFSPFAALTGYEDMIDEEAREVGAWEPLSETALEIAPIPDLIDKKECDKIERKRRVRNERTKT